MQINRTHYSYLFLLLSFLVVGIQAFLSLNYRINTDEFFFLSQVYEASRNELRSPLQTFHVHLFSWLTESSGYEIEKITLGRLSMLLAEIITATAIVFCAKPFVKIEYAIFAAFAWLISGYTISDGASFRTDPLATAFLMVAMALCLSPKINIISVIAVGILVSVACMITIKSVLYAPAFLGALFWQKEQLGMQKIFRLFPLAVLAALISFIALYLIHGSILSSEQTKSTFIASRALNTGFLNSRLLPEPASLIGWLILSIMPIYFIIAACRKKPINILFLVPIFTVVFYRNSFPYFYPFITAPAFILVALGASTFKASKYKNALFSFFVVFNLIFHIFNGIQVNQDYQRTISKVIHDTFPEPVNYIDQVSMLPTYPKKGFFMTTWGMQSYQDKGELIMDDILEHYAPPLLLANHKVLLQAVGEQEKEADRLYLFPQDDAALRAAYLKYWGPIYVAGIEQTLSAGDNIITVSIAGKYKNQSASEIVVNGVSYQAEETLMLARGNHTFSAESEMNLRLVWADLGPRPDLPEPEILELF